MGQFDDVQGGSSSRAPKARGEPEVVTYTVQKGDTLSRIAKEHYGDASQWRKIYEANKERIKNPDLIQPGWVLTIP